jgi:hypothetical protein
MQQLFNSQPLINNTQIGPINPLSFKSYPTDNMNNRYNTSQNGNQVLPDGPIQFPQFKQTRNTRRNIKLNSFIKLSSK